MMWKKNTFTVIHRIVRKLTVEPVKKHIYFTWPETQSINTKHDEVLDPKPSQISSQTSGFKIQVDPWRTLPQIHSLDRPEQSVEIEITVS